MTTVVMESKVMTRKAGTQLKQGRISISRILLEGPTLFQSADLSSDCRQSQARPTALRICARKRTFAVGDS